MEVFFPVFKRELRVRHTITIQMNMPAVSRIWKKRGKSRYSHCCEKIEFSGTQPFCESHSFSSEPSTTNTTATNRITVSSPCFFGSLRVMSGAMKIPPAKNAAAVQKRESCTCQVRETV